MNTYIRFYMRDPDDRNKYNQIKLDMVNVDASVSAGGAACYGDAEPAGNDDSGEDAQ
jgi:hypothetical protein